MIDWRLVFYSVLAGIAGFLGATIAESAARRRFAATDPNRWFVATLRSIRIYDSGTVTAAVCLLARDVVPPGVVLESAEATLSVSGVPQDTRSELAPNASPDWSEIGQASCMIPSGSRVHPMITASIKIRVRVGRDEPIPVTVDAIGGVAQPQ